MTTRAITVDQLRDQLAEIPGYYPVLVETVVGGDLGTDDTFLDRIELGGEHTAYVHVPGSLFYIRGDVS